MFYVEPMKDPGLFASFTLANGITVFYRNYDQTFGRPKVACCVLVEVGGRDDIPGKEGMAHFFEHMPFRGTKTYPSKRTLTHEIETNGGYINAFTTDETTGYEVTVPTTMIEDGIARVADMLLNPLMRPDDIQTERQIIQEEIRNKLANVNFYARQELYKGLLPGHPLVHAVLGTEASLETITKADLDAFHDRYYTAKNVSLFFTGSFEVETIKTLCERYFGSLAKGEATNRSNAVVSFQPTKNVIMHEPSHYNRSVYMLGRLLPSTTWQESLKIQLFRGMLSWGMDSPLFEEIREKRGLAYDMSVYHSRYQDVGMLIFAVSTQFKQMEEVDTVIWDLLRSILSNTARFNEAKHMLKQTMLYHDFSLDSVLREAVNDYSDYGHILSLNEFITALEALTLKDIQDYMAPYLEPKAFLSLRVNCDSKK